MNHQQEFTDEDIERGLAVLERWNGRSKLSAKDRERIRALISQNHLVTVPVCGAAAIFGVAIITIRGYIKCGVIEHADIYRGNTQIFGVAELLRRREGFRQERRAGRTVKQAGLSLKSRGAVLQPTSAASSDG